MGSGTREPMGKEDFLFHDPAAGTATQTFSRTTSTGGTTSITKGSALDWPIRDAVIVTGARTPFESMGDTQGNKNVETALRDVRVNAPHYKNFDHYGGIPGSGASAVNAAKNTEVFNKILTDLTSEVRLGSGIYFPGYVYEFAEVAGAMPTVTGISNLVFAGVPGTLLRRNSAASTALSLFNFIDCAGTRFVDVGIDRNGTAGAGHCIAFTSPNNVDFGKIYILNCTIQGGASNVSLVGDATHIASNVWISGNTFIGAGGANLALAGVSGGHILSNDFSSSGTGISMTSAGGTMPLADTEVIGNYLRATGQAMAFTRSGTYNASYHRGLSLYRNRITSGNLTVQGVSAPDVNGNTLYAGQLALTFDMANTNSLKLIDNDIAGSTAAGINITGSSCTLTGFQIRGGTIHDCVTNGLRIAFAGNPMTGGVIEGMSIIDCSRYDAAATDYSGMLFEGTGGLTDTVVSGNTIRCYTVTGLGNKHDYGIDEAGSSNRNMIGPNYIKGYQTADVRIVGALSLDVVAAVTASVATYTRFDGTAAI